MTRFRQGAALALLQLALVATCASAPSSTIDDKGAYRIVKAERLKKGGNFNPPAPPIYVLVRAEAALTGEIGLSKERVEEVLAAIILELRSKHAPDAVSVLLYQSPENVGRSLPIGRGEWWPRGHSLARSNSHNISNKGSYVLDLKVDRLPKQSAAAKGSRIPPSKRREIFEALVRSEDRAEKEAQATYPTDPSLIPISSLRSYDFATAVGRNHELARRLSKKYREELLAKYRISETELQSISRQALEENWPLPD